jgi:hypothetical protein
MRVIAILRLRAMKSKRNWSDNRNVAVMTSKTKGNKIEQ